MVNKSAAEQAEAQVIKRRGPRKKKEVIQQSDVPAATNSRLKRQTSTSSFTSKNRLICSKISFTSTERNKRQKTADD